MDLEPCKLIPLRAMTGVLLNGTEVALAENMKQLDTMNSPTGELTTVTELARQLHRSLAFGDELDQIWSEAVWAAAARRRVSEDRMIMELVLEAEALLKAEERLPGELLPEAA